MNEWTPCGAAIHICHICQIFTSPEGLPLLASFSAPQLRVIGASTRLQRRRLFICHVLCDVETRPFTVAGAAVCHAACAWSIPVGPTCCLGARGGCRCRSGRPPQRRAAVLDP